MDKAQVERLFRAIEQEAAQGAEDRMERLAQINGYMQGMIRDSLLYGIPMEETAKRILDKETANA